MGSPSGHGQHAVCALHCIAQHGMAPLRAALHWHSNTSPFAYTHWNYTHWNAPLRGVNAHHACGRIDIKSTIPLLRQHGLFVATGPAETAASAAPPAEPANA